MLMLYEEFLKKLKKIISDSILFPQRNFILENTQIFLHNITKLWKV